MSEEVASLRGPLPERMRVCPMCGRHARKEEERCPHCAAEVGAMWREADQAMEEFRAASDELKRILGLPADPEGG